MAVRKHSLNQGLVIIDYSLMFFFLSWFCDSHESIDRSSVTQPAACVPLAELYASITVSASINSAFQRHRRTVVSIFRFRASLRPNNVDERHRNAGLY